MKHFDSDEVIASRTFNRDDGQVDLAFYKPCPDPKPELDADPENPPWRCSYEIRYPSGESRSRSSVGIDSIQALLLAFAAAQMDLFYVGNGTNERRPALRWHDSDDLGLTINHFE